MIIATPIFATLVLERAGELTKTFSGWPTPPESSECDDHENIAMKTQQDTSNWSRSGETTIYFSAMKSKLGSPCV